MSGYVPPTSDADSSEPPPPYYSVVSESAAQDKAGSYPSSPPGWLYPPQAADASQQSGGYPAQSDYPSQPRYPPQSGHPPSSGYPPHSGPYTAQSGYSSAYTQQPGAYRAGHPQQSTVIVQQPLLASVVQPFRDTPVQTVCSKCQTSIETVTLFETGTLNWLFCAIMCLVGCDAGCCLIPFCIDSCKDVVHVCPHCHQSIARFNRL